MTSALRKNRKIPAVPSVAEVLAEARAHDWGVPIHFDSSWTPENLREWTRAFARRYGTFQIVREDETQVRVRFDSGEINVPLLGGSIPDEAAAQHTVAHASPNHEAFAEFILVRPDLDPRHMLLHLFHELGHYRYFVENFETLRFADSCAALTERFAIIYSFKELCERRMFECIGMQIDSMEAELAAETAGANREVYESLVETGELALWKVIASGGIERI